MIKLDGVRQVLSDTEVLNNVAVYILQSYGRQDFDGAILNASDIVSAGIKWHPDEVFGYLKAKVYEAAR